MVSDEYRLKCYDSATEFGKKNEANAIAQNTGKWLVRKETSDIDDSQNVFMTISSNEKVLGPFSNGSAPAQILIRCMENTTSVVLIMNDHFLSDIQGYGAVTYRLDEKKAANKRLQVSTDNKALGLWNGGSAIPFSKALFDHSNLLVKVTPFNESPVTVNFDITGLEDAIAPLREACG